MSGTSLDGVDAALINIQEHGDKIDYQLLEFITKPFNIEIKKAIEDCLSLENSNVKRICSLNFQLGYEFAEAAKLVCKKANISLSSIEFIASHGQTIWHNPIHDDAVISTMQIGESAVIAYETKCQVVSDFRVMDMASGGQGAPLVAFTDYLLYRDNNQDVVLQNIGGIANLTYLPIGCTKNQVISFDTGPGNMMIDYVTEKYFGLPYDEGGNIAKRGKVIDNLLFELMDDCYIKKTPPKTTGREHFGKEFIEQILSRVASHYNKEDILATLTMFVAKSIVYNYKKFLDHIDLVIISGGGSYNTYLVDILRQELTCEIKTLEDINENSSAKEAIAFALLGYLTIHNRTNNLKSATGASQDVILGKITPKP